VHQSEKLPHREEHLALMDNQDNVPEKDQGQAK
jgi:hypothetical protein